MVSERKVLYGRAIMFCLSSSHSCFKACAVWLFVTLLYWRKKSLTGQKCCVTIHYVACAGLCQFFLFGQNCLTPYLCLASLSNIHLESFLNPLFKNSQLLCTSTFERVSGLSSEYMNFSPSDYLQHSKATNKKRFLLSLSTGLRVRDILFKPTFNAPQLE